MNTAHNGSHETEHHSSWRLTLTVMFIAQFSAGVGFSFVLPFFPFYFRALGVETDSEVFKWYGWSSFAFGMTMALSAPVWGMFADRYGRKIMVLRSMFAGSVILGLMGLATRPWHLLVLRIFQGMTTGTVTASVTLVSSITPSANLGFSLGLMQTAVLLGASTGPFIGGFLADHFGFRLPCGLATIILFAGATLVFFGASERFVPPRNRRGNGLKTMRKIILTPGFPVILAIYFLVFVLSTMIIPILPFFIEELSGNPSRAATLTGVFVGMYGFLAGLSAAWLGRIGDRVGHIKILVLSLILAGLFSIPQALAQSIWALFIARCFMGLAVGGIMPSVNSLVSNIISREKIGSAYGLTASVTTLGIGMGPLIGGYMASVLGLRLPFVIMGVSALIIAVSVHKMASHKTRGIAVLRNSN